MNSPSHLLMNARQRFLLPLSVMFLSFAALLVGRQQRHSQRH